MHDHETLAADGLTSAGMDRGKPIERALGLVAQFAVENHGDHSDDTSYYVVWFCYVLGGWKALISSDKSDGRYYEVTYNKAKEEAYVDCYVKQFNKRYADHG
jgi:hypothetical protein